MNLAQALRLDKPPRLALSGAGGKTTALFQLARQLPEPVLVTASTHLAAGQVALADRHWITETPGDVTKLGSRISTGVVVATGPLGPDDRWQGLSPAYLERLLTLADSLDIPFLIEADGARQLPLKSPGAHEPAIPSFVDVVVVVAGLSGLGKPLTGEWVHRPERFSELSGEPLGAVIGVEQLGKVLASPQGGLKNIPPHARPVVLLNQADTPERREQGKWLAQRLLTAYRSVIVASLGDQSFKPGQDSPSRTDVPLPRPSIYYVFEPVAGIVLAAGAARRMGSPKQLIQWQGEPLVGRAARVGLQAGLAKVVVVTGAYTSEVEAALSGQPVTIIYNAEWEKGQSTSVKAALRHLAEKYGGDGFGSAIFLLADQPWAPAELIRRLVEAHATGLPPLVAPRVAGQRANPVLFDRVTFPDLLELSGDVGGRQLFERFPATWVDWEDANLLLDVDSPQDLERLKGSF